MVFTVIIVTIVKATLRGRRRPEQTAQFAKLTTIPGRQRHVAYLSTRKPIRI